MNSEEKAFLITGAFEGRGYTQITGNFDGAGFSFGFIQWQFKSGTLQKLLKEMASTDMDLFMKCCTVAVKSPPFNGKIVDLSKDLLNVCELPNAKAVEWADNRTDPKDKKKVALHWDSVFTNLGNQPKFKAIQRKHAKWYMDNAKKYMKSYGFISERALCLLFDICVQMGSIKKESKDRYLSSITPGMTEKQKLAVLARAVAPQGGEWASNVLARKMAIATGKGVANGVRDLDGKFNISDGPVVS